MKTIDKIKSILLHIYDYGYLSAKKMNNSNKSYEINYALNYLVKILKIKKRPK